MTQPTENNPNHPVSPVAAESRPDREEITRSEARGGVFSDPVDPDHPPRRKSRGWLLAAAAFLIVGIGRAAWPVIDISAVAQLVETVRLATDSLAEMTTAKEALLGQVAQYTGIWDDLTGEAYELGETATGVVTTAKSLANVDADLLTRRNAEQLAWPSAADVQTAYAGSDAGVVQQVLRAHQARSQQWNDQRAAWYDSQIMLAATGQFLEDIEATASTQNSTTDPGLSAQLDRHIAVSSSARDIAARQLEITAAAEKRAIELEHLESLERARRQQQALRIRAEINNTIDNQQASFDDNAFDNNLYTPVLTSY